MRIVDRLASAQGLRTQDANRAVAKDCVARPELMTEIADSLTSQDHLLAGDCAEVMTKVAETRPDLVAPHAEALHAHLTHKNGRVRWEAAHALALVAPLVPGLVERELNQLTQIIAKDKSVIVRDYLIDAVGAYGTTGPRAADRAFPVLRDALTAWEGKHAARTLAALGRLVAVQPSLAKRTADLARGFLTHDRPGIRKAAKVALRAAEGPERR